MGAEGVVNRQQRRSRQGVSVRDVIAATLFSELALKFLDEMEAWFTAVEGPMPASAARVCADLRGALSAGRVPQHTMREVLSGMVVFYDRVSAEVEAPDRMRNAVEMIRDALERFP